MINGWSRIRRQPLPDIGVSLIKVPLILSRRKWIILKNLKADGIWGRLWCWPWVRALPKVAAGRNLSSKSKEPGHLPGNCGKRPKRRKKSSIIWKARVAEAAASAADYKTFHPRENVDLDTFAEASTWYKTTFPLTFFQKLISKSSYPRFPPSRTNRFSPKQGESTRKPGAEMTRWESCGQPRNFLNN